MNRIEKLGKHWSDKNNCDPFDFSDYSALGKLIDDVNVSQRQMCHDEIIKRIEGFPTDSNLGPWYDCAEICLNATGESDGNQTTNP